MALSLSTNGRKVTLQDRLYEHIGLTSGDEDDGCDSEICMFKAMGSRSLVFSIHDIEGSFFDF